MKHGTSLMFGGEERCHLWKKDPNFPEWAWAFEAVENYSISNRFTTFAHDLKAATAADGYEIEFVYLYGPDRMTPESGREPEPITLLCDAARIAGYQRSSGRLKDFKNFTPWKRAEIDRNQLEILQREKVQLSLATMETTRPEHVQTILQECEQSSTYFQTHQVLTPYLHRSRLHRQTNPRPRRRRPTRPPRRPSMPGHLQRHLHPPIHQIQGRWPHNGQGKKLDRRERNRLYQDFAPEEGDFFHEIAQRYA